MKESSRLSLRVLGALGAVLVLGLGIWHFLQSRDRYNRQLFAIKEDIRAVGDQVLKLQETNASIKVDDLQSRVILKATKWDEIIIRPGYFRPVEYRGKDVLEKSVITHIYFYRSGEMVVSDEEIFPNQPPPPPEPD